MKHEDTRLLEDYALGSLDCDNERTCQALLLINQLQGDDLLEWIEIQRAVEMIPRSLSFDPPPAELKQQILQRILNDQVRSSRMMPNIVSTNASGWSWASAGTLACIVGLFSLCCGFLVDSLDRTGAESPRNRHWSNAGSMKSSTVDKKSLGLQHASFSTASQSQSGPDQVVPNARQTTRSRETQLRFVLFVDQLTHQMHVFAFGLDSNSHACSYRFLLSIAGGTPVSVGELDPHASGVAHAILPFPLPVNGSSNSPGPLHAKVVQHCDGNQSTSADQVTLDTDFQLAL
jgi:hypothetical protein